MTSEHALPTTGPLVGLRVVEVSSFVATPLCGLTLAQLGAEVIRVEPMGGAPDRTRWPLTTDLESLYWNGLNPGKSAIEVDLSDPRGRELVADLVCARGAAGGILISNTDRWPELRWDALQARRPDIVHVTLSGTHDGGIAVDYTVQAGSGFPKVSGPADHAAPVNSVVPAWDLAAGLYLATGLVSAVLHRSTTGQGSEVRVALEDVALAAAGHLGYLAEAQLYPDRERQRDGNYMYGGFGRDFTASDGRRFMLVALTTRHWVELLAMTGLTETVESLGRALDADFTDEGERYRHRQVLAGLVAEWFNRHDGKTVREALSRTRLLWSPYRTFTELAADDASLLREHPLFSSVDQPGVGTHLAPASPIMVDQARLGPRPAPRVGQHTREILSQVLGLTPDDLGRLADDRIISAAAATGQDA